MGNYHLWNHGVPRLKVSVEVFQSIYWLWSDWRVSLQHNHRLVRLHCLNSWSRCVNLVLQIILLSILLLLFWLPQSSSWGCEPFICCTGKWSIWYLHGLVSLLASHTSWGWKLRWILLTIKLLWRPAWLASSLIQKGNSLLYCYVYLIG